MLQRQIMFKQMQEQQRRQQLQELGGSRNQDYVDQMTSSKQASVVQLAPTGKRQPTHDSRMLMFDKMQMIQQGESSIFQGFPNELVLPQGHSNALGPIGMSPPHFDVSLFGTPTPNADKDSNLYPYHQDPSNYPLNMSTRNNNSPLGMPPILPSAIASSFMSQQGSFSADKSPVSDESLLSSHIFQERNFSGQVPFHSVNSNLFSVSYSPHGIATQRNTTEGRLEDARWPGNSPGEVSKVGMPMAAASLDPLEQNILYSSDDQGWLSSFGTSNKMCAGDFECTVENPSFVDTLPSIQSGSWSALMQSAVTETSSGDTAVQEEWSGLSFQNPEPSSDNQPSYFSNGEKLQDNWVDGNVQNVSSPCSEPEQLFPRPNMNSTFPVFQHSGNQNIRRKDEFQCESSHVSGQCSSRNLGQLTDYNSLLKHHPTAGSQLVQTSLLSQSTCPVQHKEILKTGHELKDTLWRSNLLYGGFQMPFDQLNQPNFYRYSVESEEMDPGDNFDPSSVHLGASDLYGQNVAAQSMLPNSQGFVFNVGPADSRTPQSYSLFPSLPVGKSNIKSLPNRYEKNYIKNEHSSTPVPNQMTTKFPPYSEPSSKLNFQVNSSSHGPGFSFSENVAVTQPSGMSVSSQHVEFPTGLPPLGSDVTSEENLPSLRANKLSSGLFPTPVLASSSIETDSWAPLKANQNLIKHERDTGYHEQGLENVSFLPESSIKIHNSTPVSSNTESQSCLRKHYSEVDEVASNPFTMHASPLPSDEVEQKDVGRPVIPLGDSQAFGHSLHHNYSLLHQLHRPRDCQTDCGIRFPVHNQQATADSSELLLSGHNIAVKDKEKSSLEGVQVGSFSPGKDKENFILGAQEDLPVKASSTEYLHSSQQMEMFGKNNSLNHSIDSKEDTSVAYQSQISFQMAPSWFKHYQNLKNDQGLTTCDPEAAITPMQPFSGLSIGNLPENRLIMQVDSANAAQGICPSSVVNLIESKHLSQPSTLPSDGTRQDLAVSNLKKRKIVAFDLVPWHKELNYEVPRLQSVRMAEFEWAQTLNIRQEEATNEAEIVNDVHPVVRAKRRLIFTTQLMQQVFRPPISVILFGNVSSNCDYVAYSASRTALGDACNLSSKISSDDVSRSPDKLRTSKRTTPCDFSNVVDCLIDRAEKLEGDLSRLDRSLSAVDIKVESQELEKFTTLNRFAKFHFKAQSSTANSASSSGSSTVQKPAPQRYVLAVPMPKILPDGGECISL